MARILRPTRRSILRGLGTVAGGVALGGGPLIGCDRGDPPPGRATPTRLVFIALDGIHPAYLELDGRGSGPGSDGDRLMPRLRAFLDESVWYPDACAHLPTASDMNHLNALAGTCSAQTGLIGVFTQVLGWDAAGEVVVAPTALDHLRDDMGRPVDTLFHAWKRRMPRSNTAFISGKSWIAEMFRGHKVVDTIVTGGCFPDGAPPPSMYGLGDPPTDEDAACDPEGAAQIGWLMETMEANPAAIPSDQWIVERTLDVFRTEDPGLAYVLLQQADIAGHLVGNAWDPAEFIAPDVPFVLPDGCEEQDLYQLVSARNPGLCREPILDSIRDIDSAFGELIDGLEELGVLDESMVVVLSDHALENHHVHPASDTDFLGLLQDAGLAGDGDVHPHSISAFASLYWRDGVERVAAAREALAAHRATHPLTGELESPWWVLDWQAMVDGVPGVCLPGELAHPHLMQNGGANGEMVWPDLMLLTRDGWQLPAYGGVVNHLGTVLPEWMPPTCLLNGGHGSVGTLPIVAAIRVPGGRAARIGGEVRISDLGITAAGEFGLELTSTTIGVDLGSDLR